MNRKPFFVVLTVFGLIANIACLHGHRLCAQAAVSFNRDVRPILASKCFVCHGRDEEHRQAGLRLDDRDEAITSGAITPGEPDESELIRRIFSDDPEEIMPPPHAETPLADTEKNLLRQWIAQGARYEIHWAFVPPQAPDIPEADTSGWARNAIDQFVLRKLLQNDLQPSPEADPYVLVRRVYLDLIGLPPSVEQADAFVNSTDPQAYTILVDSLLESPHYGERWARPWLDLARYSDTNGYEKDRPRTIWPYRDWVIRSLNDDMPFDQFSIEQIAGDMLPDATPDQIVATGFHRNTMLNEEGGIDPLEYRFLALVDRVATTGTVWMGLTIGCAQCHTHKYDPITHSDYYRLMALLDNADEPDFAIPDSETANRRKQIQQQINRLESKLALQFPPLDGSAPEIERRAENMKNELAKWIRVNKSKAARWSVIRPTEMKTNLPKLELLDDGSIFSSGDITKRDVFELTFDLNGLTRPVTALRLEALPDERLPAGGPGRTYYEGRKGDFFVSEVSAFVDGRAIEFAGASSSYGDAKAISQAVFDGDGSTGWQPGNRKGQRLQLVMNLRQPIERAKSLRIKILFERHYAASLGRFRFAVTSKENATANQLPDEIEKLLAEQDETSWPDNERMQVERYFLLTTPLLADARKEIDELNRKMPAYVETMVMQERPVDNRRITYRHHRGEYLSPKESVTPAVPAMFAATSPQHQPPTNRLELARWLVSDANPLAVRVAVNRAWRNIFGAGLVRTSGDFGVQSQIPTHPDLLDWLAVDFIQNGWSMKKLHRLIVTSATYRQSSNGSTELIALDPENRLLARGPRFRVTGEMVRDVMLKSSGLLATKMYGPGVRPPQPASVTALAYGAPKWTPSTGPDRYRRSIYTFSKRTAAFAAYTVFDAPTGENCTAVRNRSNTPLQALTVLNDEMYLEMAQALARKTVEKQFASVEEQVKFVFRRFLTRPPTASELNMLLDYYSQQKLRLDRGEIDAATIAGDELAASEQAASEQAALSMVCRAIMNLDETITKQ